MKLAFIFGTRPEVIKLSVLIKLCQVNKLDFILIHTNQHYSRELDSIFFEQLSLPKPNYNLGIGSSSHADQTARMMIEIEKVMISEKPNVVIVQGDTNSVLAGALVASKLGIKVAHVEAGLRSNDREMPEEINRVITDHISDYLFVPGKESSENLIGEGINHKKIHLTGNTIVDTVLQNSSLAMPIEAIRQKFNFEKDYFLATLHRPSNVDSKEKLSLILSSLDFLAKEYSTPVIFPIHPRSEKMINQFQLAIPKNIILIPPQGYLEFLSLEKNAKLVLTDSGGVQEEACILRTPCLTIRENTERPETIQVGANLLSGPDKESILSKAKIMLNKSRNWKNPFGDGETSKNILSILLNSVG